MFQQKPNQPREAQQKAETNHMKHLEMMNSSRAMDPVACCMAEIHDMKFFSTFPLRVLKAVFAPKGRKYIRHGKITIIPNPELRAVLGDSLRITRRFGRYDLPRQKKDHKPKQLSAVFSFGAQLRVKTLNLQTLGNCQSGRHFSE